MLNLAGPPWLRAWLSRPAGESKSGFFPEVVELGSLCDLP